MVMSAENRALCYFYRHPPPHSGAQPVKQWTKIAQLVWNADGVCDLGRVWDADVPEEMCAVVGAEPAMGSDHSRGMNIYVRVDVHQQKVTPAKT